MKQKLKMHIISSSGMNFEKGVVAELFNFSGTPNGSISRLRCSKNPKMQKLNSNNG